ncbi:unnamed protein product [Symbiodinium sp. CCMP2592]|nr:unnamed protein product [Symbiodinium sp. CCMP2592]
MVGAYFPQLEVTYANPLDKIKARRRRPKTIEPGEGLMPEICVLGDARSLAKAPSGSGLRVLWRRSKYTVFWDSNIFQHHGRLKDRLALPMENAAEPDFACHESL